jgi:hypothetical protein
MPSQQEDGVSYISAVMTYGNVDDFYAVWDNSEYKTMPPVQPIPQFQGYTTGNIWLPMLKDKYNMMNAIIAKIKTDTAK